MGGLRLPVAGEFDDRPVVHHFDQRSWRSFRPGFFDVKDCPNDILASQSPLDRMVVATEGGGALGTPGYAATPAVDGNQFYCESTPIWWVPARVYDLRDSWCTFYLKEIEPVSVNPGYELVLFIAANKLDERVPRGYHIDGWFIKEPLKLGRGEWAYNEVFLSSDESAWFHYCELLTPEDTLEYTLSHLGYIGWSYRKLHEVKMVGARGVVGWDEVCFNIKAKEDLELVRAGKEPRNALSVW